MLLNSTISVLFPFLFLSIFHGHLLAQVNSVSKEVPKNNISIGLVGHTLTYALIYERTFIDNGKFKTTGQIGISYIWRTNFLFSKGRLSIPITVNQLFQTSIGEFVEIGTGVLFLDNIKEEFTEAQAIWIGRLGYRFQTPQKRFIAKFLYTPFWEDHTIKHLGGVEIGYRF